MPTARVSPAERCKPACKPRVNRSRKKEKRTGRLKATADRRRQREPAADWPSLQLSLSLSSLFLSGRERVARTKKKRKKGKKRRGGERNRRERSKNLSNQFNERTRAINQLLFFRRDPRGRRGYEDGSRRESWGEVSQRNTIKGRADAFYEPPMSFLTPSSTLSLATLSDVPRCSWPRPPVN